MTDRMTISVPDQVGAYLRGTGNASAAVVDLVTQAIERRATIDLLTQAGYEVTPEFLEEGLRVVRRTMAVPPEVVARVGEHREARLEEGKRRRFARADTDRKSSAA